MPTDHFELDFYETGDGKKPCLEWIKGLEHVKKSTVGHHLWIPLQQLGLDVVSEGWGRQLGGGLTEFKIQRSEQVENERGKWVKVKTAIRIFFHAYGEQRLLILHGYDKGRDPSSKRQDREIAVARKRLDDWKERQKKPGGRRPGKG